MWVGWYELVVEYLWLGRWGGVRVRNGRRYMHAHGLLMRTTVRAVPQ